jgi:serine/threonine protein kinase
MNRKPPLVLGNYSEELKALVLQMLDFEPHQRPSVHKILEMPLIKRHLTQTLEKTIHLCD